MEVSPSVFEKTDDLGHSAARDLLEQEFCVETQLKELPNLSPLPSSSFSYYLCFSV